MSFLAVMMLIFNGELVLFKELSKTGGVVNTYKAILLAQKTMNKEK